MKNTAITSDNTVTIPPKIIAELPLLSPLVLAIKPSTKPIGPRIIPNNNNPTPEHTYDALISPFWGGCVNINTCSPVGVYATCWPNCCGLMYCAPG